MRLNWRNFCFHLCISHLFWVSQPRGTILWELKCWGWGWFGLSGPVILTKNPFFQIQSGWRSLWLHQKWVYWSPEAASCFDKNSPMRSDEGIVVKGVPDSFSALTLLSRFSDTIFLNKRCESRTKKRILKAQCLDFHAWMGFFFIAVVHNLAPQTNSRNSIEKVQQ